MSNETDRPGYDEVVIGGIVRRAGDSNTAAQILFGVSRRDKLHGAALAEAIRWQQAIREQIEEAVSRIPNATVHDVLLGLRKLPAPSDYQRIYIAGWQAARAAAHQVEPAQPSKRF